MRKLRKFKRSIKQMYNYASWARQGSRKQINWMRKIYNQKITQAVRSGESKDRIAYLKTQKRNWTTRFKVKDDNGRIHYVTRAKIYGVRPQTWKVATSGDIMDFALYGKEAKQGGMLIIDNTANGVTIAYAGTQEYEEAMALKGAIYNGEQ